MEGKARHAASVRGGLPGEGVDADTSSFSCPRRRTRFVFEENVPRISFEKRESDRCHRSELVSSFNKFDLTKLTSELFRIQKNKGSDRTWAPCFPEKDPLSQRRRKEKIPCREAEDTVQRTLGSDLLQGL